MSEDPFVEATEAGKRSYEAILDLTGDTGKALDAGLKEVVLQMLRRDAGIAKGFPQMYLGHEPHKPIPCGCPKRIAEAINNIKSA